MFYESYDVMKQHLGQITAGFLYSLNYGFFIYFQNWIVCSERKLYNALWYVVYREFLPEIERERERERESKFQLESCLDIWSGQSTLNSALLQFSHRSPTRESELYQPGWAFIIDISTVLQELVMKGEGRRSVCNTESI